MAKDQKDAKEPANAKDQKDAKEPKLVKMKRQDGKTADVHPDEVGNFAKGGYVKVDA